MNFSVWLILALPLLGSLLCATHYRALGRVGTGVAACSAILGAFLVSLYQAILVEAQGPFQSVLGKWLALPGIRGLELGALVDPLSVVMLCTVTGVAFLIHCYSMGYMADEEEYGRFFASLNLFVATMVCLVLANNLGLLLVGWGGVGYASYSLIGFYRLKPSAVSAARKAFLINVVGDVGIMLAACLIAARVGALDYITILGANSRELLAPDIMLVGALLLVGAYAKSAQLPMHGWLPDAMEGPTPVSALIHAATMVTAGVYLLVRCHPLFETGAAAVELLPLIAMFGATTALVAGLCAVVQNDLKRILAYSTMSQLGYMFMACGLKAYSAAMFHLVTHAFFKALLFLTAGVVIHALHGQQDIRKMGGLGKKLLGANLAFAIGAIALTGLPPLSGFYSKEAILMSAYHPEHPEVMALWVVGIVTALLTAYYTGRAYVLVFWAPAAEEHHVHHSGSSMGWPLAVLALLAALAGFAEHNFTGWLHLETGHAVDAHHDLTPMIVAIAVALAGVGLAWWLHRSGRASVVPEAAVPFMRGAEMVDGLSLVLASYWRKLADGVAERVDPVPATLAPDLLGRGLRRSSALLCQLQNGSLRIYALAVLAGAALLALFVYALALVGPGGGA